MMCIWTRLHGSVTIDIINWIPVLDGAAADDDTRLLHGDGVSVGIAWLNGKACTYAASRDIYVACKDIGTVGKGLTIYRSSEGQWLHQCLRIEYHGVSADIVGICIEIACDIPITYGTACGFSHSIRYIECAGVYQSIELVSTGSYLSGCKSIVRGGLDFQL